MAAPAPAASTVDSQPPTAPRKKPRCALVLVRGPSGAGKSTTSALLADALARGGPPPASSPTAAAAASAAAWPWKELTFVERSASTASTTSTTKATATQEEEEKGSADPAVAAAAADAVARPGVNVVLVESDDVHRKLLGSLNRDGRKRERAAALTCALAETAWSTGVDVVVVEGVLNVQQALTREGLERMRGAAPGAMVSFYLDVPFDETVRRHGTRSKKDDFGEQDMLEWWPCSSRYAATDATVPEVVLPATSTAEETVATMLRHIWSDEEQD